MNQLAGKRAFRHAEHAVRGLVGHQHRSGGIGGDNGNGTAVDEYLQLFFGILPCVALAFNLVQVFDGGAAAPVDLADEEAGSDKGREEEHVA